MRLRLVEEKSLWTRRIDVEFLELSYGTFILVRSLSDTYHTLHLSFDVPV